MKLWTVNEIANLKEPGALFKYQAHVRAWRASSLLPAWPRLLRGREPSPASAGAASRRTRFSFVFSTRRLAASTSRLSCTSRSSTLTAARTCSPMSCCTTNSSVILFCAAPAPCVRVRRVGNFVLGSSFSLSEDPESFCNVDWKRCAQRFSVLG